jgi:hypothetical protein
MIANITIKYATSAKLMKMNHTTSQNDISGPFSLVLLLSLRRHPAPIFVRCG